MKALCSASFVCCLLPFLSLGCETVLKGGLVRKADLHQASCRMGSAWLLFCFTSVAQRTVDGGDANWNGSIHRADVSKRKPKVKKSHVRSGAGHHEAFSTVLG